MTPAEAARKTKEFRCPPKEQMNHMINCKHKANTEGVDADTAEMESCPTSESLQVAIRDFCAKLVILAKIFCKLEIYL
jgi:hypothetical protein